MDSISLRGLFNVNGFFYKKEDYTFRKLLNIIKKSSKSTTPDLMVIMMNPGSSHPEGTKGYKEIPEDLFDKMVPTVPDNTQDQIMRLMLACNFKYARIINLSDLCESKSNCFYSKLKDLNLYNISHSIFYDERKLELEKLMELKVKLIVAWGVNKSIKDLAEKAIGKIGLPKIGLNKENIEWAYYHPLPRSIQKKKEWVKEIENQILLSNFND